jgi:hypothetical protein
VPCESGTTGYISSDARDDARAAANAALSFPQRALFDKIGIRTMRIETDPFGNFLGQGYELGCGRDWTLRTRRFSAIDRNNRCNSPRSTPSEAIKARTIGSFSISSTEGSEHRITVNHLRSKFVVPLLRFYSRPSA